MGRPPSTIAGKPTHGQLLDALDTAARRAMAEIVGDTSLPVRGLVADIFAPIYRALRRAGRRNGPLPPRSDA